MPNIINNYPARKVTTIHTHTFDAEKSLNYHG